MVSSGKINGKYVSEKAGSSGGLPEKYGKTEIALMPRDPQWVFAYWEITPEDLEKAVKENGVEISAAAQVLRICSADEPGTHFDLPVRFDAGSWYVKLEEGGKPCFAEIGLMYKGRFIPLARSNTVGLPSGRVSEAGDEKWMRVGPDFQKLLQLSGIERIGGGSGEIAKNIAQRWEILKSVFSRMESNPSPRSPSASGRQESEKGFRFSADCGITLFGSAEPGSTVFVGGKSVSLGADGAFRLEFPLPDGITKLRAEAVSPGGERKKTVIITIDRRTESDG